MGSLKTDMNIPRIMIAAPSSGSGKTLITCGLLELLKDKGLNLSAFKCGPDYIDPMFHSKVLGLKSRNLDSFFTEPEVLRQLFEKNAEGSDMAVIEGVMGYYDGLGGFSYRASAYDVACITNTPVIFVLNCKGMSLSVIPYIKGFLEYEKDSHIKGVILNKLSPMLYKRMKQEIEGELPVKVLGYVPQVDFTLESRHLGLIMPDEIEDLKAQLKGLAEVLEESLETEEIIKLARSAEEIEKKQEELSSSDKKRARSYPEDPSSGSVRKNPCKDSTQEVLPEKDPDCFWPGKGKTSPQGRGAVYPGYRDDDPDKDNMLSFRSEEVMICKKEKNTADPFKGSRADIYVKIREKEGTPKPVLNRPLRIGLAKDEAFCFFYEDNLSLLREMGAELIEFSPIHDPHLPEDLDGLLLYGGYPELSARELSENLSMKKEIRQAIEKGLPTMAECGGFMYLHEKMEGDDGNFYPMAGVIKGTVYKTSHLTRFGYVTLSGGRAFGREVGELPSHEFHYYDSENCGDAFLAKKPLSGRSWRCIHSSDTLFAGYPHMYYYGNKKLPEAFLAAALRRANGL